MLIISFELKTTVKHNSPAFPGAHPVHDFPIDHHETYINCIEKKHDDRLVMLEVPIPGEPDETADRQGVEQRVSDQWSPVKVQHLQSQMFILVMDKNSTA